MSPLQKQTIDLPLAAGLDTKSDPKQTKRLTELVNAYIERTGEIRRRPGVSRMTDVVRPYRTATALDKMVRADAIYGGPNGEVILRGRSEYGVATTGGSTSTRVAISTDMIATLSNNKSVWQTTAQSKLVKHDLKRVTKTSLPAAAADDQIVSSTVIEGERYRLFVYTRTTSRKVYITILDKETGARLHDEREISDASSYTDYRGLHIWDTTNNRYVFIVLLRGETGGTSTVIQQWIWDPATPQTLGTIANIVTDIDNDATAENLWDAKEQPTFNGNNSKSHYAIAYRDTGNVLRVRIFSGTSTTSAQTQVSIGVPSEKGFSITNGVDSAVYIFFVETSGGIRKVWLEYYDTGTNAFAGPVAIDTVPAAITTVSVMTTLLLNNAYAHRQSADFFVLYGLDSASLIQNRVAQALVVTGGGVVTAGPNSWTGFTPVTRLFSRDRKAYCVLEVGADTNQFSANALYQRTFFLAEFGHHQSNVWLHLADKIASLTAATRDYETVANIQYSPTLAQVSPVYDTDPLGSLPQRNAGDKFVTVLPIQDRLLSSNVSTRELLVSHAECLLDFDPKPPRAIQVGRTTLMGGGIVMGYDSEIASEIGFHISPDLLSLAQSITGAMADGTYNYKAIFEWSDANGQIYRSNPSPATAITVAAGGGTASVNVTVRIPTILVADPLTKISNIRIVLYRTEASGSVYYRTSSGANASAASVVINDTQVDASIVDNEALYTTGGVIENIGPPAAFSVAASDSRAYLLSQDDPYAFWFSKPKQSNTGVEFSDLLTQRVEMDGPGTALAVIDGAVIQFKKDSIYLVSGDGPNDVGLGAFNTPRKISKGIGCRNYASIVETDHGVFFESERGIYLLSRQLTLAYVGAPLQGLGDISVRSATVVGRLNQVRFVRDGTNQLLVFDYENGIWSVWEYATVLRHGNELVGDGFYLCGGGGSVFKEDSTKEEGKLALTTSWISTTSLNGYQRLYWIYLLGQLAKGIKLVAYISYDYKEDIKQTVQLDGSSSQWRIKPKLQKCTAFRVRLVEQDDSKGELRLSSLSLVIGQKKGYRQLKESK